MTDLPPTRRSALLLTSLAALLGCSLTFDSAERGRFTPDDASSDAPDDGSGGDDVALTEDAPVEDTPEGDVPLEDAPDDIGEGDAADADDADVEVNIDADDAALDAMSDPDAAPCDPERCPTYPNTAAACSVEGACAWTCQSPWVDQNLSLEADGCECMPSATRKTVCDHINDRCVTDADICCGDGELVHQADHAAAGRSVYSVRTAGLRDGLIAAWIETDSTPPNGLLADRAYLVVWDAAGSVQGAPQSFDSRVFEVGVAALGDGYLAFSRTRIFPLGSPEQGDELYFHAAATRDAPRVMGLLDGAQDVSLKDPKVAGSPLGAAVIWERASTVASGPECAGSPGCLRLAWFGASGSPDSPNWPPPVQSFDGNSLEASQVAINVSQQQVAVAWLERPPAAARRSAWIRVFNAETGVWQTNPLNLSVDAIALHLFPLGFGFGALILDGTTWTLHHLSGMGQLTEPTITPPLTRTPFAAIHRADGNALLLTRGAGNVPESRLLERSGALGEPTALASNGLGLEAHATPLGTTQVLFGQALYNEAARHNLIDLRVLSLDTGQLVCALPQLRWSPP